MLTQLDTRGFVVRAFTPQEIMDAIDVRGVLEGLAARMLAEQGPSRRLIQSLHECLREGDEIFAKRHLVESDEARYGEMNKQFHDLIIDGAGSKVIAEAIERNGRIPFAAAHAIAFDKVNLPGMYESLRTAHRQHHAIVQALENGEGARVAALMFEHAYGNESQHQHGPKGVALGSARGSRSARAGYRKDAPELIRLCSMVERSLYVSRFRR